MPISKTTPNKEVEAALEAAMSAPYRRELVPNDDGTWFARVAELPGCMTEGDTAEEALANLTDAMHEWLRVQLEDGDPVPLPTANTAYSGKFVVRVSPRLHRELVECAAREGVSLNAYASIALARTVGDAQRVVRIVTGVAAQAVANQAHVPQVSFSPLISNAIGVGAATIGLNNLPAIESVVSFAMHGVGSHGQAGSGIRSIRPSKNT